MHGSSVLLNLSNCLEARDGNGSIATCPDPGQRTLSYRPSISSQDVSHSINFLYPLLHPAFFEVLPPGRMPSHIIGCKSLIVPILAGQQTHCEGRSADNC